MKEVYYCCAIILCLFLPYVCDAYFTSDASQSCFCKLEGQIDDCSCNVDTVDHFNNMKIFPRLQSLLSADYFRFYKVNLKRDCPFWTDDSRCAIRYCNVQACQEEDIPPGLKQYNPSMNSIFGNQDMSLRVRQFIDGNEDCEELEADLNEELGYLNTTISAAAYEEFEKWQAHDALENFCEVDEDKDAQYVDLLLNPERYTGYKGKSAHRIWNSIYKENCFRPENHYDAFIQSNQLNRMCLEKRVFYRVISGMHASINIHLCSKYLLSDKESLISPGGKWGANLEEFKRRFSPLTTDNEGPHWLRNLYFLYLLELRALAKAAPYLTHEEFFTGSDKDDRDVRDAVRDLLSVIKSFPNHFDESTMFTGGAQATKLKDEFRQHFRNISVIMDCVGCEKCKLWGKLQVQGIGAALKILFSGKFESLSPPGLQPGQKAKSQFQLQRGEIVTLFNAFGRLSNSINELEMFRKLLRE
ncbi:ero1-like protein isoform X1 [Thrips palmi]|uniref:Ero1-like protein isoform X1 n=1 Tax=Thrips palmi TaxID=161013 RepID=A0A6P9ABP2_THRPL|nr:ero1-like protein isoform X1 [Thrips palmi]